MIELMAGRVKRGGGGRGRKGSRYPEIEEVESFIQRAIGNREVIQEGNNSTDIDEGKNI